jgi:bacteriocin biosynthesis cyclodehydratase domain-containing protein
MLRPRIKRYFDVFRTDDDRYQVRGSEYVSVLSGKAMRDVFTHLLPLLNGEHTTDEIIEMLRDVSQPEIVRALIRKLGEIGILEDASDMDHQELSPEQARTYQSQMMFFGIASRDTLEPNEARFQKALFESKLSILGAGELAARTAAECAQVGIGKIVCANLSSEASGSLAGKGGTIETRGLALEDLGAMKQLVEDAPPSLLVLSLERPEPAFLDRVNKIAIDLNIPLLHSQLNGIRGVVGPLVVPGKTACLKCHQLRVIRNYDYYDECLEWERWIEGEGRHSRSAAATLGPFTSIIAGLTALEIVKKLSGFYEPELYGHFLTVSALTQEVIPHRVLRIPRCPSCGKLRGKPTFSPWVRDERNSSQERIAFRPPINVGKNGGGG